MGEAEEPRRWLSIYEPLSGTISSKQEAAIRAYAADEGFPTLRGFASRLRMLGWDYYDVLRVSYT